MMSTESDNSERFFKDPRLPFAECRYSQSSARAFKPHIHQSFCVGAASKGKIQFQIDNQEHLLEPGILALINPETLHSCNPAQDQPRSFYMLYLELPWCLGIQQGLWQTSLFLPSSKMLLHDTKLYTAFVTTMDNLMARETLLAKEQQLTRFMGKLFERCCTPETAANEVPKAIQTLKHLLAKELAEDITLSHLAKELAMNPYTLLRHFKKETGITPHAYRMNCRMSLAKELLAAGTDIGDTAYRCGFCDQSHFHRHFKAMTTVTPRQYQVNFIQ